MYSYRLTKLFSVYVPIAIANYNMQMLVFRQLARLPAYANNFFHTYNYCACVHIAMAVYRNLQLQLGIIHS